MTKKVKTIEQFLQSEIKDLKAENLRLVADNISFKWSIFYKLYLFFSRLKKWIKSLVSLIGLKRNS